jgi:hypothetical protein
MNNATLGRFVDGGNHGADLIRIGFGRGKRSFLQGAKLTRDTTVSKCTPSGLTCAFSGGFRVGHEAKD